MTSGTAAPPSDLVTAKARHAVGPAVAYHVSLAASPSSLWPTQYSTLTARSSGDVGPTPYWISIVDVATHTYLARCGSGTVCTASVTRPSATAASYQAYVSAYPTDGIVPPGAVQATSQPVTVSWHSTSLTLSTNATTLPLGRAATLVATTGDDVGPSPFYIEIFDTTTGGRLTYCGFGTSCTATVSQPTATTHSFVAHVAPYGTTAPPAGAIATSTTSYITWSPLGHQISLTVAPRSIISPTATLTATSTIDVGPTPYFIEILNQRTGALVTICGTGTSCVATVSLGSGSTPFIAFIAPYSSALPPAGAVANSNRLEVNRIRLLLPRPRPLPLPQPLPQPVPPVR
ncbi:hypothetical protein MXD60_03210 [Frankia sp. AgB32]|nr:hypothetical protein [Frankia sp. AgB32]